jgi:peptidoglycan/xylan/chitin deacetylase (PgdA/CDA1 family)
MFEGLDPSKVYWAVADLLTHIILVLAILLLIFKTNIHKKFFKWVIKSNKKINTIIPILIAIAIIGIILSVSMVYYLDHSTKVSAEEKIVVIEIDDYWNIQDTEEEFTQYGYSMKNYRSVSDIIDKHGFTATVGVSPHIFVETTKETFDIADDPIMIDYLTDLQEKGYELAMHGYSHCRNRFFCPRYEEVWFNVLQGKNEIEDLFDTELVTYLPPGNEWTTEQYNNVKEAGFFMIPNTHVPEWYYDENVIITPRAFDVVNDWDWYSNEYGHSSLDEWKEVYEDKEFFVMQLHCNTFDSQNKLNEFEEFLIFLKEEGVRVVTYKEAYEILIKNKAELSPLPN